MKHKEGSKKSVIKAILNVLSNIILVVLAIFIVYMLFFMYSNAKSNEQQTIFNHRLFIVQSDSMSPTFRTGTLLLIKQVDPQSIQAGDIITFRTNNDSLPTTHRVVEILEDNSTLKFVTRGDANNMNDPTPVDESNILGKVVLYIPLLGYVMGFIRTKQGIITVIIIPAFILMVSQIIELIKYRKKYKSEVPKEDIKSET